MWYKNVLLFMNIARICHFASLLIRTADWMSTTEMRMTQRVTQMASTLHTMSYARSHVRFPFLLLLPDANLPKFLDDIVTLLFLFLLFVPFLRKCVSELFVNEQNWKIARRLLVLVIKLMNVDWMIVSD